MSTPLYDSLSKDYDRFVDWPSRLAFELPFLRRQLEAAQAKRVLDAACGSGMHSIALAQDGYQVTGVDLSAGMIQQAKANAQAAGLDVAFVTAGFGNLAATAGAPFDALLCLGNSLPHVLTRDELATTVTDMAAALRPGGLLLLQNRNFDAVLKRRERWLGPQSRQSGEREWLFVRFYEYEDDGTLTFHVLTLQREGNGRWQQGEDHTRLYPWRKKELVDVLAAAGFHGVTGYGDMTGEPFCPDASSDLVIVAQR